MRRLLYLALLLVAVSLTAPGSGEAASNPLGLSLRVSKDFTVVTYIVKNKSTRTVGGGTLVTLGSSHGWPIKYIHPLRWKMNGATLDPFNENIYDVILPRFAPGQTRWFSATFKKEDVSPKTICHMAYFTKWPKSFVRGCRAKV